MEEKATKLSWTSIPTTAEQLEARMYHTTVTHPDKHCLVIYGGEGAGTTFFV
jgi:hypothetical protein